MRKILLSIILVSIGIGAVTASGCGSSDSSDSASAPTKSQYVKEADAICAKAEGEQFQLIVAYKKKHPTAEEEEMVKPAAIPPLEEEMSGIKALATPEGDEDQVQAWINAFEASLQKVKNNPHSILNLRKNPFEDANKKAAKLGFKTCSSAP
jgi:hypothetical protein